MATPSEQIKATGGTALDGAPAVRLKRLLVVDKPRFSRLIHRMLSDRFEVVCVEDGLEAVRKIRYRRPDVILAEMSVRGGGLRLAELMDMSVRFAHTPFLLTCIKPTSDLVEKVKRQGIDGLIVKPFPPSSLIEQIGQVLQPEEPQADASLNNDDEVGIADKIKEKMRAIEGLPPFPATHAKVMELANSDASNSEEIAEQIQRDPNFLATVLKLANSSFYGFSRKVDSLKLAVSLLGLKEIVNLAVSLQVFQQLSDGAPQSKFDTMAFWKHSVGTAFIARVIAQKLQTEVETAFLAGLLHDIGKVILDRFFTEFYGEVLERVQAEKTPFLQAELETLNITHAHVGGYLAVNWNFADTLIEAVVCHHDPAQAKRYTKLASVIHVANAICNHLEYGSSGDVLKQEADDPRLGKALWKLGIGPHSFDMMVELGQGQLSDADAFLGMLAGNKGE